MWAIHTMEHYSAMKKDKILINATYMNFKNIIVSLRSQGTKVQTSFPEKTTLICSEKKNIDSCLGEGEREWRVNGKWHKNVEMFSTLIGMVVTWVYKFVQTHQNVYLKWVYFIVSKAYLNKVNLNIKIYKTQAY